MVLARARRFLTTPWSARFDVAVRDVSALLGIERPRGPAIRPRSTVHTGELRLVVAEVIRETADAVTLVFEPVDVSWRAGQFLSLTVPIDGGVKRAYSVSAAPGGALQVTVKRVPGGKASSWLVEHAAVGQVFFARGPSGNFVFVPEAERSRRILLVGGGSGITPLIAIAEEARTHEPRSEVHLVFGNRSVSDAIFLERLRRLDLGLALVFEDDAVDPGRLDRDRLTRELHGDWDAIYVCGPRPVMDTMRELAVERGWPTPLEERFESLGEKKARASDAPQALVIQRGGRARTTVVKPSQTLLEAGLAVGEAMPFSCTMGGCGACRVRLVEGEVVHDEPNGLSASEKDDGFVFACIARPTRPCTIEVP